MERYTIYRATKEIKYRDRNDIVELVTLSGDDIFNESVASFESLEQAEECLIEKYGKTSITDFGKYYLVEEHFIIKELFNEDFEEWEAENFEILRYSKIMITVEERETWETLGIFDNFRDAEECTYNYDGDHDTYISL